MADKILLRVAKEELADIGPELAPEILGRPDIKVSDRARLCGVLVERPDSESYHNMLASVKAAGFPEAGAASTCNRLMNNPSFVAWRDLLRTVFAKACGFDADSIRCDVAELQHRARAKNDLVMLAKAIELKGKFTGQIDAGFVERTDEEIVQMSERRAEEARRIASLRLAELGNVG